MYNISELSQICEHLNIQEEKANKAQRDSIRFKQCQYMKGKVGETFSAVISGIQTFGVFAEITENGCDGMLNRDSLEEIGYFIDTEKYLIINNFSGVSYMLGDQINVKVVGVNMTKKQIDLMIAE